MKPLNEFLGAAAGWGITEKPPNTLPLFFFNYLFYSVTLTCSYLVISLAFIWHNL
ncbi:hypothetical protein ACRRTK_003773 [Alexandromys fortis]